MIPNRWIIFWNNQPVGLDDASGGYPFKTEVPSQIKYWKTKDEAEKYSSMFIEYAFIIHEIQFRIVS